MPLVKRNIEPRHLCRGPLPEGIGSELDCVTNNNLSAIIRQLSSLSKHAEDIFGELFNEANTFHLRANSLQDRIDRLAVKVTQLDSTVEEVSLQDINMRKAFKSATVQDQQVVSKSTIPNPVQEIYNVSDKPPPLNILSPYRDDQREGMEFYTDPSYFFQLWKEKMLQDTEDKRKEKRRQKEQRRSMDGTLPREVRKVRKARNRRQEWNMMAFDKELRPDNRHAHTLHRGMSSEGSLSPENRSHGVDIPNFSQTLPRNPHARSASHSYMDSHSVVQEHEYHSIAVGHRAGASSRHNQPLPLPPSAEGMNGVMPLPPADYSVSAAQMMECSGRSKPLPPPPAPIIPSAQTAFATPLGGPTPATPYIEPMAMGGDCPLPPPPPPGSLGGPAPPGPPPLPPAASHPNSARPSEDKRQEGQPVSDARSDLLSAIRMGIQLKKVQEQQELQAKREPMGNDVATILSRRIAVEYSDSGDDSELDYNEWSD
ncbi:actin-binding protein WASF3-like [Anguilla rostrata]|uniref:actin-binding protein WASF3-like n=1 Tax=Anguilla rostrata TaxID=7938 RepID=UPI0030D5113F